MCDYFILEFKICDNNTLRRDLSHLELWLSCMPIISRKTIMNLNFKLLIGNLGDEGSIIKCERHNYYKTPGMDLYVSEYGNVLEYNKTFNTVSYKPIYIMRNGYLRTYYGGHTITMQRLVAFTFGLIDSLDVKLDIDHLNKCRSDNRLCNLEPITHAENIRRRDLSGNVNDKPVACYLNGTKVKDFKSQLEAARWILKTGQSESMNVNSINVMICNAYNHKNGLKTAYGYEWK